MPKLTLLPLNLNRDVQSSPSLPVKEKESNINNQREIQYEDRRKRKKRRKIETDSSSATSSISPNQHRTKRKKKTKHRKKKAEKKEEPVEDKLQVSNGMEPLSGLEKLKKQLKQSYSEFNNHFEEIGKEIGPHNYEIVALLGVGAQGRVYLVRLVDTKELFAMKVILKEQIIDNDKVGYQTRFFF